MLAKHSIAISDPVKAMKARDCEPLLSSPHLVTLHLDLPVVYLCLTKTKGINRAYYEPDDFTDHHRFDEELYQKETVFMGYVFENTYIVEDICVHLGVSVSNMPITQRLTMINNIIDHRYVPDPVIETRKIVSKDYVEYEYLRSFIEQSRSLPYARHITGLRFCPINAGRPIIVNDTTELKADGVAIRHNGGGKTATAPGMGTYAGRHTIVTNPKIDTCVFSVRKTDKPDVYELYLTDTTGTLRYYDIACIPDKKTSQRVKTIRPLQTSFNFNRISCVFNREFGRWTPNSQTNAAVNCITDLI